MAPSPPENNHWVITVSDLELAQACTEDPDVPINDKTAHCYIPGLIKAELAPAGLIDLLTDAIIYKMRARHVDLPPENTLCISYADPHRDHVHPTFPESLIPLAKAQPEGYWTILATYPGPETYPGSVDTHTSKEDDDAPLSPPRTN